MATVILGSFEDGKVTVEMDHDDTGQKRVRRVRVNNKNGLHNLRITVVDPKDGVAKTIVAQNTFFPGDILNVNVTGLGMVMRDGELQIPYIVNMEYPAP